VEIEEALFMFPVLALRLIVQPRAALKLAALDKRSAKCGAFGTALQQWLCPGVTARELQAR
jgi:hypothetical protein